MFTKILQEHELRFNPYTLFPPASDRSSWTSFDSVWQEETVKSGEHYLHFPYPQISATDFLTFTRTGNRTCYEDKFFAKRLAFSSLVLAECVENTGRFLDDIINGIFSICEESAWQLPAHNSYIRDTPQLPLPDTAHPVLDLFACETGAILATAYYLLKEKLDTISPFICKRIRNELHYRIFTPYLNCHFWWMGNGNEPMNNWTIWCTQNVLLSVFLSETEDSLRAQVLTKACKSADYFLDEYGDDGCCDEGAQYYRHAGLCLFNTLEIMNAVTNDLFASLYHEEKIRNIASYIMNVHINDVYYLNFADCSPIAGRAGVREFLFGQRTGNHALMSFAAKEFLAGNNETLLLPKENNLYYRLQNGFTINEIKEYGVSSADSIPYPDIFYPSTGIFITRDDTLYLAVKGGDNDDSHNHNDTGSFTVYKNGKPIFIDIGVESYTKKTFSPARYTIWTMQSAYHNLPTLNGIMQKDGAEYKATDITYRFSNSLCEIQLDIASAYPDECRISHYSRKAVLHKGNEIRIEDTWKFCPKMDSTGHDIQVRSAESDSVILNFMTYEKPQSELFNNVLTFSIGTDAVMEFTGGSLLSIEEIPITDPRLMTAWQHPVYRIQIKAEDTKTAMRIY